MILLIFSAKKMRSLCTTSFSHRIYCIQRIALNNQMAILRDLIHDNDKILYKTDDIGVTKVRRKLSHPDFLRLRMDNVKYKEELGKKIFQPGLGRDRLTKLTN
jgi:hypothetical protein